MSEKKDIRALAALLAARHSMTDTDAEQFARTYFELITQALEHDRYVKVKGLGIFKLITVESRESVDVNTGERIEIQGHSKISFTPDTQLRDTINKPFAHFETVVLNPGVEFPDLNPEAPAAEQPAPIAEAPTQAAEQPAPIAAPEAPKPEEKPEETAVTPEEATAKPAEATAKPEETTTKSATPVRPRRWKRVVVPLLLAALVSLAGWYFTRPADPKPAVARTTTSAPKTEPRSTKPDTASKSAEQPIPMAEPVARKAEPAARKVEKPAAPKVEKPAQTAAGAPFVPDSTSYIITGTMGKHTVGEGETLTRIALRYYGTKALWPYLVKHNAARIKNPNHVPAGTTLDVPRLEKKP